VNRLNTQRRLFSRGERASHHFVDEEKFVRKFLLLIAAAAIVAAQATPAMSLPEGMCRMAKNSCLRGCGTLMDDGHDNIGTCTVNCYRGFGSCLRTKDMGEERSNPPGRPPKPKFPGPGILNTDQGFSQPQGPAATGTPGRAPTASGPVLR
jgi:hypothetical protein